MGECVQQKAPNVCQSNRSDENYQIFSHPAVSRLPREEKIIKNRFIEAVYRKYPHILPKRKHRDTIENLTASHPLDNYQTSYQADYGLKNEPLNFTRCPGIRNPTTDRFQSRDPDTPNLPGMFDNSLSKESFTHNFRYTSEPKTRPNIGRPCTCPKWASEYQENYTRMAKIFKSEGVYKGNGRIYIKRQKTISPFDNKIDRNICCY